MKKNIKIENAAESIFKEVSDFILIGLTGRTGSGCTTTAKLLASKKLELPDAALSHFEGNERRKYRIIKRFIDREWKPFHWLQLRNVITRYILDLDFETFCGLVSEALGDSEGSVKKGIADFEEEYTKGHNEVKRFTEKESRDGYDINEERFRVYFEWLPTISSKIKKALSRLEVGAYTKVYQLAGDNIRASGCASSGEFNPDRLFDFPLSINEAVKSARSVARTKNVPCYVVIDAIRNPYEALFFKERYADFFMMSINTKNENRLKHLRQSHKFSEPDIIALDEKEYPEKLQGYERFVSQNIQKCIEFSDIHINNPKKDKFGTSELASQLAWYVSLMMHPGLVMPTSMESCMQIAYSVKKNSGCISRQVGAVVTDASFSVKGVGWNNSPQGQVPCLLRSAEDLLKGSDPGAYSSYERNDQGFRDALEAKFEGVIAKSTEKGRTPSFCFKDLQNEIDDEKNQVHTRSLHAEENAFLQISKYGGQKLAYGKLFTTASPCELCAKKAYQIGIKHVYYIDPYPGIATSHVMSAGDDAPELILFRGAIGVAFHRLYQPLMPFKDELDMLLDIPVYDSPKKAEKMTNLEKKYIALEKENSRLKEKLDSLQGKD